MRLRYKILILLIVLTAGAIFAGSQFEPVKAATRKIVYNLRFKDGLVGYWSFNGADISGTTAYDRSGGGNNGTLTNGPTAIPGTVGQALNFDGGNDYVDIGDPADGSLDFGSDQSFSISLWFKTNDTASGQSWPGFISKDDSDVAPRTGYGCNLDTSAGTLNNFYCETFVGGTADRFESGAANNDNLWHHGVFVRNAATGNGQLYLDNAVKEDAALASTGSVANDVGLTIGLRNANNTDANLFLQGQIDEVRIYNRALSAGEVAYIYARTKPAGSGTVAKSVANNSGLAGFWDFDDCDTCTTVTDRSGNSNTGTMYDATGPTATNLHVTGKTGNGSTFDGVKYYVDAGNASNLNITGNITIGAWIKPNTLARSAVVAKDFTDVRGYMFGIESTGEVYMEKDGLILLNAGTTMSAGGWNHIAVTFDGAGWTTWLNGVPAATSGDISGIPSQTTTSLTVGRRNYTGVESYFDGIIDEVKIYNRALSAAEIKNLYNSTQKMFVNMPQNNFLTDGLVGFWSFNGPDMSGLTAIDRSGSGNNGTLTGGPTAIPGMVGQALNFDGTNDYVDGGTITTFNLASISVSAWVYSESVASYYSGGLTHEADSVVNAYDSGNYGWKLGVDMNGKPVWLYYNATGGCIADVVTSSGSSVVGGWHNLTGVRSTAGLELFVDGVSVGTGTQTCDTLTVANPVFIGEWRTDLAGDEFDGSIDEVRIYNRVLSATEVLKLYNAGKR